MSCNKDRYAVGIVVDGAIASIPFRRLTIDQAAVFVEVHNRLSPKQPAVIMAHPISPAILRTSSKSRSA